MQRKLTAAERARLEEELWDPEPGDMATGVVLFRDDNVPSEKGDPRTLLRIHDEDRNVVLRVFCGRSVLAREVKEQDPRPGDEVAIRYLGEKETKTGTRFHAYKFEVDKPPSSQAGQAAPVPRSNGRWWEDFRTAILNSDLGAYNPQSASGEP